MEYALVTILISELNLEYDMELPTDRKIGEIMYSIIETLTNYRPGRISVVGTVRLLSEGKELNKDLTLSDYDIWDGSILELSLR